MGADDLRSSIKDYIEDVNFLEAICTLVQSHSVTKRIPVVSYDEEGYFDPMSVYSAEEIATFESEEDFLGYSIKGEPLFGAELAETADREIAAIQRGEAKGISLEELKAKTTRWLSPTK